MAEQIDLTIRAVEAIRAPAAGRIEFRDTKAAGLYLRVTSSGAKTFSFVGRAKGVGRVERLTIGKYPAVKPEEARRRAVELAGQLAGGLSVAAANRERRGELALTELFKLYLEHVKRTAKSSAAVESLWRLYLEPAFGTRRLSELRALDVERWHHGLPVQITRRRAEAAQARARKRAERHAVIADKQALRRRGPLPKQRPQEAESAGKIIGRRSANMAVELLRAMFNFAMEPKRQYFVGINPASQAFMFPNAERDRFLQPDELAPFFAALAAEPSDTMRDFILIALLTAMRKSNVASMRWSDVNLERGEWRVAGELMKNGEPHTAPLGPEAVTLLQARKQTAGKSLFVFASDRSKTGHVVDIKRAWARVMARADLKNIKPHDLRRTLGSWQARTGASLVLIGKSLAHKNQQSTAIYARLDLDPVRQSMERATSAMFEAADLRQPAQVLEMKRSGKREVSR